MVSYLAYGAIGLALALAVLAYRLLAQEQRSKMPRKQILSAINVYLGFALTLALAGFAAEFFKKAPVDEGALREEVRTATQRAADAETKRRDMVADINKTRAVLRALLNMKSGALAEAQRSREPDFSAIRSQLALVDSELHKALDTEPVQ